MYNLIINYCFSNKIFKHLNKIFFHHYILYQHFLIRKIYIGPYILFNFQKILIIVKEKKDKKIYQTC